MKPLSWIADLWKILETVATLTKEVERANSEIKELRRDVNTLTLTVSQLRTDLAHETVTTELVLDNYKNDIDHVKESIAGKFDVLTTRLDLKISDFERRFPTMLPEAKKRRALKGKSDEGPD